MNEQEINSKLKRNTAFLGTFAINELDEIKINNFPAFAVINMGERLSDGIHWIALAIYFNDLYLCDSLGGLTPESSIPQQLVKFLHPLLINRKFHMTKQLQPETSGLCGLYCTTFINVMSETHSFCKFISLFTSNLYQNDHIIKFLNKSGDI